MATLTPLERVLRLAERQHGVVGFGQAREYGLTDAETRRAVHGMIFERLHRNVLRATGSPETWHQQLMAATLADPARAVVSHRAAAALYRLDGFPQTVVEITIDGSLGRYRSPRGIAPIVHTSVLAPIDRTTVGCIPTLAPMRMLISLGAVVGTADLVRALDTAERLGLVHRERLARHLDETRRRGRNGVRALASILERRERLASLPWTVLERQLLDALREAGLPLPETQYPFDRPGLRKAFLDFAWVVYKLAVEADGGIAHALPEQRKSDYSRDRDVQRREWRILRFTYEEIMYETAKVVAEIRDHLVSRGAPF